MSRAALLQPSPNLLAQTRQWVAVQPFTAATAPRLGGPRLAAARRRQRGGVASRAQAGSNYVEEKSFRIEQVSFGSILSPIGLSLMVYGFGAFFNLLPGGDLSSLMLIYGFPITAKLQALERSVQRSG
ncbi:hypothetical protein CHLNCDRAFT_136298 [Chlorella variabilis]|uniref:Uncharacterized protein n=1 Tax=Chlorella variabilis TaxID=554065 RepID=E1ZK23_CHLVA|nr:hypothetical protein CHLNCDRAFT_136298 [Chlorella variabilis]EFN53728.1 hypothetical protein CHLNCDRAFT_136298 [Chlorella variabilis]|eukprot:XP_005845830.1 hypothetical protein CHLNCDRAFT_136298 [Chlorella variabilis]